MEHLTHCEMYSYGFLYDLVWPGYHGLHKYELFPQSHYTFVFFKYCMHKQQLKILKLTLDTLVHTQ